jgi:hypothetical protein
LDVSKLKDVAAVGGWKDIQTLVNCYQQADDETMLRVMSHPKKISQRVQTFRSGDCPVPNKDTEETHSLA